MIEHSGVRVHGFVLGDIKKPPATDEDDFVDFEHNLPYSQHRRDFATFTERYSLKKKIGVGKYGNVYRALDRLVKKPDQLVAIKMMTVDRDEPYERLTAMNCEAALWETLVHPNIVRLYCTYSLAKNRRAFVCQLCNSEDLFSYVSHVQARTGSCRLPHRRDNLHLMRSLLAAIDYMHNTAKIAHRDIKPENIMIHYASGRNSVGERPLHEAQLMLGDFTFSEKVANVSDRPFHEKVGTLVYVAPEIWLGHDYGVSVDCWAAGVVLYECWEGFHPCWSDTLGETGTMRQVSKAICDYCYCDFDHAPMQEQLILDGLLTSNVSERMTADMAYAAVQCIIE